MIPESTRDELIRAMTQFDLEIRDSDEMRGWERNAAHKYAIRHNDRLYPVKKIVSIATGLPVSDFSGGWGSGQANEYVEKYGLSVTSLDHQEPTRSPEPELHFPYSSYSWEVHSPTVAVKQMDKSAFLHHGTGVPREITFFFDFKPGDDPKSISLEHAGRRYEGHLSPDTENQRVRLFWQAPFSKLIEELMPGRYQRFINGDDRDIFPAEMRFVKEAENIYSVDFLEPETIIADAEKPDEEPSGTAARSEGTAKTVTSTVYERDPQNRLDAIRIHGHQCVACGFDFGKEYGKWGDGYIEVHHLVPLAEVDENHQVNPETDLAPVCANCHRMIHRRRGKTLTIDELREMIVRDTQ